MNNYKLLLVFFSILITGCNITPRMEFKKECNKRPENYFDKSLFSSYEKEKSVHILYDERLPCSSSYLCSLIERGDRWESIQMISEKSITYVFYRDYEFKNCIANYSVWKENRFLGKNGDFCVASKFEKEIKPKLTYSAKITPLYDKNYTKISKIENKIYLNKKLFLSYYMITYSSPSASDQCYTDDLSKQTYFKDFSWSK